MIGHRSVRCPIWPAVLQYTSSLSSLPDCSAVYQFVVLSDRLFCSVLRPRVPCVPRNTTPPTQESSLKIGSSTAGVTKRLSSSTTAAISPLPRLVSPAALCRQVKYLTLSHLGRVLATLGSLVAPLSAILGFTILPGALSLSYRLLFLASSYCLGLCHFHTVCCSWLYHTAWGFVTFIPSAVLGFIILPGALSLSYRLLFLVFIILPGALSLSYRLLFLVFIILSGALSLSYRLLFLVFIILLRALSLSYRLLFLASSYCLGLCHFHTVCCSWLRHTAWGFVTFILSAVLGFIILPGALSLSYRLLFLTSSYCLGLCHFHTVCCSWFHHTARGFVTFIPSAVLGFIILPEALSLSCCLLLRALSYCLGLCHYHDVCCSWLRHTAWGFVIIMLPAAQGFVILLGTSSTSCSLLFLALSYFLGLCHHHYAVCG